MQGIRSSGPPTHGCNHHESKSRGSDENDPIKARRFASEQKRLYDQHGRENILDDPYYNPSLTYDREDFSESADLKALQSGQLRVRYRE